MEKIILASNNKHKIKEFNEILTGFEIIPMADIGFHDEIVEDGLTFRENSKIKVDAIAKFLKAQNLNCLIMADDSGLCVDALNGAPGVFSARYSKEGVGKTNRALLLKNLGNETNRKARFVCCITLLDKNGNYIIGEGKVEGRILTEEVGDNSFGYDCLFFCEELGKTFGVATDKEKNSVSHRSRAIKDLLTKINVKEK